MKDSPAYGSSPLPIDLPELSLQVVSLLQIAFFIGLAALTYYITRKFLLAMGNSGAVEKRTLTYQVLNISTFIFPGLIFLYGLTSVSQDSLFVSLLFFVIFSIVLGFSLVDPTRSLFSALLITIRGDLRVGDYISMGELEGEITTIGAFNVQVHSKTGTRTFVPAHRFLNQPYEIHAKKGGPSIVINLPESKISKRNLARLAHLCSFKRKGSDIRISTMEGQHRLSIEIVNREARPWVQRYFEKHLQ